MRRKRLHEPLLVDFNGYRVETKIGFRPSDWLEEKKRMKPLQIALLVVAGAVGGAIVMKVTQRPQPAAPAPVVAQNPAPVPEVSPVQPVAPAPAPEPEAKPAPFAESRARSKPKPVRQPAPRVPEPAAVAQNTPPVPVAAPVPAPQPQATPEPTPSAPREPEFATPPPPPPPEPRQVSLNAGMLLPVRLIDGLTTERNNPGDTFTGTLDQPLVVDGLVIAERGARVEGRVVVSDKGGKVKGVASLAVELTRVHLSDGQTISV